MGDQDAVEGGADDAEGPGPGDVVALEDGGHDPAGGATARSGGVR